MILERFKVPEKDQVRVSDSALRETVTRIFEKLGVTPEDAADAADVLVMTDLRGVETHGVSNMLRAYVRDYRAGKLARAGGSSARRPPPRWSTRASASASSWGPGRCAWPWTRPAAAGSGW
jgi:hypothetical protein